jgi:hypothetical protein
MHIKFLVLSMVLGGLLFGCSSNGFAQKQTPFGINQRPQPTGTDLQVLLPKTVGNFTREDLPPGARPRSDEDLNVEYKSGNDQIFFGFSIPDTEKDAHEAIKVTRQEAIDSKISIKNEQYVTGKNPSYFKIADFISWTRGKYFFYAKASSSQALERFMRSFPF